MTRALGRVVMSGAFVFLAATVSQAQTGTTSETKKFRIIAVDGNRLVVRLPEGTRELTVPDDFRFNIDGRMLSVRELEAGMAGTATITTRTTVVPVTVTEVKNGTVAKALGTSIIVNTGGVYKAFSQSDIDKRGVTIMRDGKPAQISDFRENDRISASIITTKPPKVLTAKEVQATLARSTPAAAPVAAAPAAAAPAAAAPPPSTPVAPQTAAATSGRAPKKLPKTASPLPVLGLAGLVSVLVGGSLTARRRHATR
jgi:LPXTG-motif cell wall-anchored protein